MLYFKKIVIWSGLVIYMALAAAWGSAAEPQITSTSGTPREGYALTIKGANFSAKTAAAPLLFWFADGGTSPSALGRKGGWDSSTFGGTIVDSTTSGAVIAEGSKKALMFDFGASENAVLAKVHFDSERLYVWRKRYDDFDAETDYAVRTRYVNLLPLVQGATLSVGMLMSTSDKSIWGKITKNEVSTSTTGTNYYLSTSGTLLNRTPLTKVPKGETLYFYAETDTTLSNPLLSAELNEGQGIFVTFNHKIIRLWGMYGSYNNNSYVSYYVPNISSALFVSEYTQVASFWGPSWDNILYPAKRKWVIEELQYQNGTVDTADGIFLFWQDRVQGWKNQTFRFTTSAYPHKYSDLYQNQVSNGAKPGSKEYYDALYVDDTWHRVVVCAESTWVSCTKPEVLIPSAWNDTSITVTFRAGGLASKNLLYLYVVNADGVTNANGFEIGQRRPLFQ